MVLGWRVSFQSNPLVLYCCAGGGLFKCGRSFPRLAGVIRFCSTLLLAACLHELALSRTNLGYNFLVLKSSLDKLAAAFVHPSAPVRGAHPVARTYFAFCFLPRLCFPVYFPRGRSMSAPSHVTGDRADASASIATLPTRLQSAKLENGERRSMRVAACDREAHRQKSSVSLYGYYHTSK